MDFGGGSIEVDWSRQRMTLSASFEGYEGDPITPEDAAIAKLPAALEPHREILAKPQEFGPVKAMRWIGVYAAVDKDLELELWKLPGAPDILEVSFEEADATIAAERRDRLIEAIEQSDWVMTPADALKTDALFKAFS